jgi:hypothetical protein
VLIAAESLVGDFGWVQDVMGFGCDDATRLCGIDHTVKQFLFPGARRVLGPAYLEPLFAFRSPEAEHLFQIRDSIPLDIRV